MDQRKRDAILRRMAQYGGAHIVCLGCGARGRHMPGSRPRLSERRCARCGTLHPRLLAWVQRNPRKAAELSALAKLGVFEGADGGR